VADRKNASMKQFHKVGLAIIASVFVISVVGRFFMREDWDRVSAVGLPVVLVAVFVVIFVLALREQRNTPPK
jgi:hypothetical protein